MNLVVTLCSFIVSKDTYLDIGEIAYKADAINNKIDKHRFLVNLLATEHRKMHKNLSK